jgi:predicted aldo/keto reductase-like oxidoreductase
LDSTPVRDYVCRHFRSASGWFGFAGFRANRLTAPYASDSLYRRAAAHRRTRHGGDFDVADSTTLQKAGAVVHALIDNGGKLIDTASTYGDAESVLGDVIAPAGLRDKVFIATKLESPDSEELKRSLNRLRTTKLDLLQFHNVRNPGQSLAAFKSWKAQGVCRYIGITSTSHGAFPAVEAVLGPREAGFCANRLFDRRPRSREAASCRLPLM